MNCFLPWNLKDMTNISAEKLQKNISQQTSYIEMYRSELLKESLRFNVAGLLRHLLINRSSFNTDDLSKRATDSLIVFLHSTAFLKKAYFAPTDAENPAVGKCVRNLHRLMLENVKATMKYLDYYLLLDIARGKIAAEEMYEKRKAIHDQILPDTDIPLPFKNDAIGSEFLKLVEMENSQANEFSDFEVLKHCNLSQEICQKLSAPIRSDDEIPESRFGIIGACKSYLDTPFIRYGNTYYSFVSSYCLRRMSDLTEGLELNEEAPVVEPVAEPEPEAEEVVISEPVQEETPEPEVVPEPEVAPEPEPEPETEEDEENSPFDESDEIESESEEEGALKSDDDSAYLETDEYEFPDEFEEEKTPDSEVESEEQDVYEETEEIPDENIQPANPNDDTYYDEEPYTALVSPDTYEYLENAKEEEFTLDPMLEEQESLADAYDEYEEDSTQQQEEEEEDPYSGSLFDILDESEDEEESEPEKDTEETPDESQSDEQDDSFPPFEEEEETEESEPEPEPQPEPEPTPEPEPQPEPEPTPEPEPEPEPEVPAILPLIEQILSFSPSRNNPITQYLTNSTPENQKEIVRVIELARKSWLIDGKDKMFTIPETNISVAVFLQSQDPMKEIQRRENIGAVMYASSKDNWNSLELSYDAAGKLVRADFNRLSKSSFTDWEWKVVEKLGERIIERRSK